MQYSLQYQHTIEQLLNTAEATEDLTLQPRASSTAPNLQIENVEHKGAERVNCFVLISGSV